MKHMIPMNESGLFATNDGVAMIDSRYAAEKLGKRHDNVLRIIRNIHDPKKGASAEFNLLNFEEITYCDNGRVYPAYAMTESGLSMVVMSLTGKKAFSYKERYIALFEKLFEQMQATISAYKVAKAEFPVLTDAIKATIENAKPYHYSNEADLLNRIILGKNAKQFRIEHGLKKGVSIRPYLTAEESKYMARLEIFDANLLYIEPDYHVRKAKLTELYSKLRAEDDRAKLAQIAQITAGTEAV